MISIKPKWVAKILNGEKTIEIRKSIPKCDLPIDVYIYCTKQKAQLTYRIKDNKFDIHDNNKPCYWGGKVIAKFTLNKVEEIRFDDEETQRKACLTEDELFDYLFVNEPYHEDMKKGYAWHIDNLVIFDKPKELCEFRKLKCDYKCPQFAGCDTCSHLRLTKAPQNMAYVEIPNDN
jgi:predicted transcriptional regulator